MGANSSNIPKGNGSGGIISESERNFLAENEFELAPTARQQVYTEQFYLYLNLTKPSKHLYITYCDSERDGSVNEPSYIISRINKIFPSVSVKFEERKQSEENAWSDDERNILSQVLEMEIFLIKNGRRYIIVILTQRRIKKRLITY